LTIDDAIFGLSKRSCGQIAKCSYKKCLQEETVLAPQHHFDFNQNQHTSDISPTCARMPSQESSSSRPPAQPSKAGITTDENGIRHIPASVRADGSVRKEIRIKPGYRPPEDVEVYRNRTAEAWKNRGQGGVPGADPVGSEAKDSASTSANKNAKRREARKKAAAAKEDAPEGTALSKAGNSDSKAPEPAEIVNPEVEKEKQAKKLAKKLRQARELKDKKESGSALLPEQFEKVIRINELIRQLDSLGFDANGEKKEAKET